VTPEGSEPSGPSADTFEALMSAVLASANRFGHREHVHVTWLAVRTVGMPPAIKLISDGIQRTARYAGAPQKYNATVSRAWVELVGHHAVERQAVDFADFARLNDALFDTRLLTRFYRSSTLAGEQARQGWVEPDLEQFPWAAAQRRRRP
jgi:hypothetical protein